MERIIRVMFSRNYLLPSIKPVLIFVVILSEIVPRNEYLLVGAEPASAYSTDHNRLQSDTKSRKSSSNSFDDDFGKESSARRYHQGRDDFDSKELERSGAASGRPLSTSAKESLIDYRDNTGCPPDFQGLCKCGYDYFEKRGKMFIVNCTRAGFSSVDALQSLPQNTEVLIFTGNCIPSLPPNIFGNKRTYPELVHIDLSYNGIENILGKTFHRVNATDTLILSNNNISRLTLQDHKRIFSNFVNLKYLLLAAAFEKNPYLISDLSEVFIESNLTKLEKIHLEWNSINYISDPTVFCELPSLLDLHLSQNELSDLNLNITCLEKIRYIDLTYNKIRTVGENSGLWKLLHEKNLQGDQIRMNLWENPFDCDCRSDAFIQIVRNWTRINPDLMPYGAELKCKDGFPKNNTLMHIKDVVYTECPILQASDYGSTVVSAMAWVLAILCLVGIGYFLYSNQNLICRPVNPLHQTTTQGVKYTTIQEEEAEVAHV